MVGRGAAKRSLSEPHLQYLECTNFHTRMQCDKHCTSNNSCSDFSTTVSIMFGIKLKIQGGMTDIA